jgi:hypothetical protein
MSRGRFIVLRERRQRNPMRELVHEKVSSHCTVAMLHREFLIAAGLPSAMCAEGLETGLASGIDLAGARCARCTGSRRKNMNPLLLMFAIAAVAVPASYALAAPTAEQKCASSKLKAAGTYQNCLHKAEAVGAKTGEAPDSAKCDLKLGVSWDKAEATGAGACQDALPDDSMIAPFLKGDIVQASAIIAGSQALAVCGDGSVNAVGELCDGSDLDGTDCAALSYSGGALACDASCKFDASGCLE